MKDGRGRTFVLASRFARHFGGHQIIDREIRCRRGQSRTRWQGPWVRSLTVPVRFWIAAGVFETDPTASGGVILGTSRHLRDVLLARDYDVAYTQFSGGHEPLNWRGLLSEGLESVLGRPN
jgi:hypothetical protein